MNHRAPRFYCGAIVAEMRLRIRNWVEEGQPTMLGKIRYLLTVSGGGYTGSASSWYQRKFGFFPFGEINLFSGSQNNPGYIERIESAEEESNTDRSNHVLNYIRQNGAYLMPSG